MSLSRLAIRGVIVDWVARACTFVIAFFVTPILIRRLGNEAYGIWCIVLSFNTYYALADLGLTAATTKYVAQFHAVSDRESVNKAAATTWGFCCLLALVVLVVVVCVAVAVPSFVDLGEWDPAAIRQVIVLAGLSVVAAVCGTVFSAMLVAVNRYDLWNGFGLGTQILQAALLVLAVQHGGGLVSVAWIVFLVALVRQVGGFVLVKRILGYVLLRPSFFDWKMLGKLLRFGVLSVVEGMAKRVTQSVGPIVIGILLGPAVVTFYAIADTLAEKSVDVTHGIRGVLMPIASLLDAQDRRLRLAEVFFLSHRTLLAIALGIAAVLVGLGWPLIDVWIGEGYAAPAYPVLCVFAAVVVGRMPGVATRGVLRGMGRVGALAGIGLVQIPLTLVLGVALVRSLGLVGMALAILLGEAATTTILLPIIACRALGVSLGDFVRKGVVPAVAAAGPPIAAALAIHVLSPPWSLLWVLLQAAFLAMITAASAFFICLDRQLRTEVLRTVLAIVKSFRLRPAGARSRTAAASELRAADNAGDAGP